jgi:hypothetical protein
MSENLQQSLLENEQANTQQLASQEVSHANLTALRENVKRLMMTAICGGNSLECIAKLEPSGLWRRMYGDYFQVKMDGSLEEYLETWPNMGVMRGGTVFQLTPSAHFMKESELPLLPAPTATDYKGVYKDLEKLLKHIKSKDHQVRPSELLLACGVGKKSIMTEYELMMGYPVGWTELRLSGIA